MVVKILCDAASRDRISNVLSAAANSPASARVEIEDADEARAWELLDGDPPDDGVRLIFVSDDDAALRRAAAARGFDGVVCSDELETTLAPTVAAVCAGQTAVPRRIRSGGNRPSLSSREKQVLALVVLGLSNGEIAKRLFLTESTVKSHLTTSFKKLDVTSRKDAVARILDPEDGFGTGILSITGAERLG